MSLSIEERVLLASHYIVENKATVRQAAQELHYSKSTVHKDVTYNLPKLFPEQTDLYNKIRQTLETNRKEGRIKGGKNSGLIYFNKNNISD